MRDSRCRLQTPKKIVITAALVLAISASHGLHAEPETASQQRSEDWNLFTVTEEAHLGKEVDKWIQTRTVPVGGSELTIFLNGLFDRLNQDSTTTSRDSELKVHAVLLADSEPHSFVVPGGTIYITSGLIAASPNENHLAALLAHQTAHAQLRHVTRNISRAKRFVVPAALAAASTGKVTLLTALEQAELAPLPGAPWMEFNQAEEAEAISLSVEMLEDTTFEETAARRLLSNLHSGQQKISARFLEEHPLPNAANGLDDFDRLTADSASASEENRDFEKMRSLAGNLNSQNSSLTSVYAWSPPEESGDIQKSRELFVTRSYLFSYPSDWSVEQPGEQETIIVAPKGEREMQGIRAGVIAGTLPWDPARQDARKLLLEKIAILRPGLEVKATPEELPETGNRMTSLYFSGRNGPLNEAEVAWVLTRGLSERVFYLMMISPRDEFSQYLGEFERIYQSIDFTGHPEHGQADALTK